MKTIFKLFFSLFIAPAFGKFDVASDFNIDSYSPDETMALASTGYFDTPTDTSLGTVAGPSPVVASMGVSVQPPAQGSNILSGIFSQIGNLGTSALLAYGPQNSALATTARAQAGVVSATSTKTWLVFGGLALAAVYLFTRLK